MTIQELFEILMSDVPSKELIKRENELFELVPNLKPCKGFNQNTKWHIYDVYGHILHVIDNVPKDPVLRIAALFHDVGKPPCYYEDDKGQGHFKGHWIVSEQMFNSFAKEHHLDEKLSSEISELILFHDIRVPELSEESLKSISSAFGVEGIKRLYQFKKADLLSMNQEFHHLLDDYVLEEERLSKMTKK